MKATVNHSQKTYSKKSHSYCGPPPKIRTTLKPRDRKAAYTS